MKLLLVSDLHYTLKQLDWVSRVAGQFDLVVVAGDLIDIVSVAARPAQVVVLLKYLKRMRSGAKLIVSSGNHDLDGLNRFDEQGCRWLQRAGPLDIVIDGDCLEMEDTLFTVCPWWDGPCTRDEVGAQLARDARRRAERWIWIYHAPPDESPTSWGGQRDFGDADLRRWIHQYQPDMVLAGHIHQSPFRKGGSWVDRIGATWVFNSGRQIGPCPTHIVFDLERGQAMWFSLAGNEVVDLHGPLIRPVAELLSPGPIRPPGTPGGAPDSRESRPPFRDDPGSPRTGPLGRPDSS